MLAIPRDPPQRLPRALVRSVIVFGLLPALAFADAPFAPGEVIVKFRSGTDASRRAATRSLVESAHALRRLDLIGAEHLRLDSLGTESALAILRADPTVEYAEPNYYAYADVIPNDPRFPEQYALHNTGQGGGYAGDDIKAPEAWNLVTGDPNLKIGVIDTGIDYTHPDLAANIWTNPLENPNNGKDDDHNGYIDDVHGYDFVNGDGDPMDDSFHGTHVAGTIGAVGDNGVGVTGVNWHCTLVGIKFMNASGIGTEADAISSIQYAVGLGIRITNNSWGNMPYSTAMQDAIAAAGAAGQLLVFAAGNNRRNNDLVPDYPSCYDSPYIVSVAATDARDLLATFSNYGPTTVDLGAPGWSILSTMPGALYATKDGTSMAAPHVTGVATLAMAHVPSATNLVVRELVLGAVDPIPSLIGLVATNGRLDAFKTLTNAVAVDGEVPRAAGRLRSAGPNPDHDGAAIELSLPRRSGVELSLHDVSGRRVRLLSSGALEAGTHRFDWDGRDDGGATVASGVYFARARTEAEVLKLRLVLLR